MKEIEEYTAEVFDRSKKRIKERKRNQKRIIITCIPIVICITAFSTGIISEVMPKKSADYSAETTEDATTGMSDKDNVFDGYLSYKQDTINSEPVSGGNLIGSPTLKEDALNEEIKENADDMGNKPGTIIYQGKTFVQIYQYDVEEKMSALQIDKYLGNAKSFNWFYKNEKDIDGKVYTVKDNSDLLIIQLDNGEKILLKMTDE